MFRSLWTNRWVGWGGILAWLAAGAALAGGIARHPHYTPVLPLTFLGWFLLLFVLVAIFWQLFLTPLWPRLAPSRAGGRFVKFLPVAVGALSLAALFLPADGVAGRLHHGACFLGGVSLYLFVSTVVAGTLRHWGRSRDEPHDRLGGRRPFDPNDPRQHPPFRFR